MTSVDASYTSYQEAVVVETHQFVGIVLELATEGFET
jgi:hypothetical protein